MHYLKLFIVICYAICTSNGNNIVLIITDDQDVVLDGMTPLNNTKRFIANEGVTYQNAFAAVPVCCPNRASILTGKYQHNHETYNNSLNGGCNSKNWQSKFETNTFAAILKKRLNYNTFYAGKYLNKYGHKDAGGVAHIPPGWDKWYGLVGNSKYYDYSLSINGYEKKYITSPEHYLTDVIKGFASDFINGLKKEQPFLMVLAPPAPHAPFVPAARHSDRFKGVRAKRTKNFNKFQRDKHWLARMGPTLLPSDVIQRIDQIYRKRWETLLAVDELVYTIYNQLKNKNLLNDTYIIFTSDNGYHLGQFAMPLDKRQPYETDIRVPLLIRGPGIKRAVEINTAVSSVDLFATILDMAGTEQASDGVSLLRDDISDRTVLIEYRGEKNEDGPNSGCPSDSDPNLSYCDKNFACKCEDAVNNTFSCVRRVAEHFNNIFCVFNDKEHFTESYDLLKDEFQMENIGPTMSSGARYRFRKRVKKMSICKEASCVATNPPLKLHAPSKVSK